jgi:hypothetical protein
VTKSKSELQTQRVRKILSAPRVSIPAVYRSPLPGLKTEPHASAGAVERMRLRYLLNRAKIMVGVAGLEPATSSFRTKSRAALHSVSPISKMKRWHSSGPLFRSSEASSLNWIKVAHPITADNFDAWNGS